MKTGLYADKFMLLFAKLLSLIRFENEPYTLYNRPNASRLTRLRKTRKRVSRGKHKAGLLL